MDDATLERSLLLGLSYQLLGSVADAEDCVQEAYVRWYRLPASERKRIESPRGWLIRTSSRIGLDMLKSARARRERYVGEWLPEPIPGPALWNSQDPKTGEDPADALSLSDSASMALLIVLESMTPAERVSFVLHEVFRYPFAEIGEIVGRTPEASRKLASTARRRVRESRQVSPVDRTEHAAVVRSFAAAWSTGDLTGLIALLDPRASAITDGGGLVSAALDPIVGAESVGRFFLGVRDRQPGLSVHAAQVHGELGIIARAQGRVLAVITLTLRESRIDRIWAVRNPEKLRRWGAGR